MSDETVQKHATILVEIYPLGCTKPMPCSLDRLGGLCYEGHWVKLGLGRNKK